MRVIFKYVSGVQPLITSQRYISLVTILVMSQKLWIEGDVIPKALVGILEKDRNDEEITDETQCERLR